MSAALEAKIVRLTLQSAPPSPLTHWTIRRLAATLGVAHTTITTVRHSTRSLNAALDVGSGHVPGNVAARHTSAEFVDVLDQVVRSASKRKAIHVVVDNLSAHVTQAVNDWLAAHPA